MADIIEIIKKASIEAMDNSSPTSIFFGLVTNINPLEIQVEQKLILTKEFLILTKNVIDYDINISLDWSTEANNLNANHNHAMNGDIQVESLLEPNTDNQNITNTINSNLNIEQTAIDLTHNHNINGNKKITIHNALKQNDKVILIQQQGGQKFIVLDKIY